MSIRSEAINPRGNEQNGLSCQCDLAWLTPENNLVNDFVISVATCGDTRADHQR
jgi:hypothetical protein